MDISKILLNAGEALRPALTKIIPMKMLSRIKAGVINNAADKLSADAIIKYEHGYYKEGANVIGNVKGDNGLGQSARIMCRLLDENNEEHVIKDFFVPPGGSRTNDTYDDRLTDKLPYDVNIIHVNASEMMVAYVSMGKQVWDYRYNIGYWAWELETFPEEWIPAFKLVDEIWTPSDFVTNTLKKYTDKPVITVHTVWHPRQNQLMIESILDFQRINSSFLLCIIAEVLWNERIHWQLLKHLKRLSVKMKKQRKNIRMQDL